MTRSPIKSISCQQLQARIRERSVEIVDVRTPEEFRQVRAVWARNVPIDLLDPQTVIGARTSPAEEPLYFICHLGGRSAMACAKMMAAGHLNVFNVDGGIEAWIAAGLPTEEDAV